MKSLSIKLISILIIFIITVSTICFAATKTELNNEQSSIDNKIDEAEDDLKEVKTDKSQTLTEIEKLTSQISSYEDDITGLETQINELNGSIKETQSKLDEATENYNNQQQLLNERLIALYEAGDTTYLDFLLSADNLTELISNWYLVSELTSYGTDLLDKIEEEKNTIETAKKELETSKSKVETAKKDKLSKSNQLKAVQTTKNEQVAKLSSEEKQIQSEIDQFEKDKKAIQNQLAAIARREAEEAKKNSSSNAVASIVNNPSASGYIKPVAGYSITTPFHGYAGHTGADFSGAGISGKPILAVKAGTVVTSTALKYANGSYRSYGEYIVINHHDGTMTLYAHGAPGSRLVSEGQTVKQGQQIMSVGTTGNSTGYHLHFEVRVNGVAVNPASYL